MKNATRASGKVLFIVLIVLVAAVLLAAGAGFYFKNTASSSRPDPQPVVTRHKIVLVPVVQPKDDGSVIDLKPSDATAPEPVGDLKPDMNVPVEMPETDEADTAGQTDDGPATPSIPNIAEDTSAKPLVEPPAMPPKIADVQTTDEGPATPSNSIGVEETIPKPLVEPPATVAKIADAQTMQEKEYFTIQVGAFRSNDNANRKVAELLEKGYEGFIIEIGDTKSQPLYAVRFGHFVTKSQARTSLLKFKEKEKVPAFIMRSDQ